MHLYYKLPLLKTFLQFCFWRHSLFFHFQTGHISEDYQQLWTRGHCLLRLPGTHGTVSCLRYTRYTPIFRIHIPGAQRIVISLQNRQNVSNLLLITRIRSHLLVAWCLARNFKRPSRNGRKRYWKGHGDVAEHEHMKTSTRARMHLNYKLPLLKTFLQFCFWRPSLFFLFRPDFGRRKSKNSRTLSAEIAWNKWYCVLFTVYPNFQDPYSRIADSRELSFLYRSQELQEAIKKLKLEEEVLEKGWRCGCHLVASKHDNRDMHVWNMFKSWRKLGNECTSNLISWIHTWNHPQMSQMQKRSNMRFFIKFNCWTQIFLLLMRQLAQLVLPLPNRTDFGSIWKKSKHSRTLSAEIAWNKWYCVLFTLYPNFRDPYSRIAENCHFFTKSAKRQQLAAHHTNSISSLGCMVLGQEFQEAIKTVEEEVLERAWRCGCHLVASMRGDGDVVENVGAIWVPQCVAMD